MPRRKSSDNDKPLSIKQARGELAKAMSDLVAVHDPGVISFRLKRTKKANEPYPLRLTQQQREIMIHAIRIKNKLRERLKEVRDPHHERHEELLEWAGPFDPEAFEAKKATMETRKVT
jgi:hypothetical protein